MLFKICLHDSVYMLIRQETHKFLCGSPTPSMFKVRERKIKAASSIERALANPRTSGTCAHRDLRQPGLIPPHVSLRLAYAMGFVKILAMFQPSLWRTASPCPCAVVSQKYWYASASVTSHGFAVPTQQSVSKVLPCFSTCFVTRLRRAHALYFL